MNSDLLKAHLVADDNIFLRKDGDKIFLGSVIDVTQMDSRESMLLRINRILSIHWIVEDACINGVYVTTETERWMPEATKGEKIVVRKNLLRHYNPILGDELPKVGLLSVSRSNDFIELVQVSRILQVEWDASNGPTILFEGVVIQKAKRGK